MRQRRNVVAVLVPMVTQALGRSLERFRMLPRDEQQAKLTRILERGHGPAGLVARRVAKSPRAVGALLDALASAPSLDAGASRANPRWTGSSEIQTLLFDAARFTPRQAARWAREHGFRAAKVDVGVGAYLRVRQHAPGQYERGKLRTITLSEGAGVKAVVGVPRRVTGRRHARRVERATARRNAHWERGQGWYMRGDGAFVKQDELTARWAAAGPDEYLGEAVYESAQAAMRAVDARWRLAA